MNNYTFILKICQERRRRRPQKGFKEPALPWYSDQILPFDITCAMANEYGAAASSKLFGVEILNEGFGFSVDDSVIEQQATFVARTVAPLQAVGTFSFSSRRGSRQSSSLVEVSFRIDQGLDSWGSKILACVSAPVSSPAEPFVPPRSWKVLSPERTPIVLLWVPSVPAKNPEPGVRAGNR
jgi:hypothetical protein